MADVELRDPMARDAALLTETVREAGLLARSMFRTELKNWIKGKSSPVSEADIAVNDLIEQTLFLLKHHQRFRRITVERRLGPDLPPVLANDEQMIQVLMALMLNGADSMDEGGVLTVDTRVNPVRADEVVLEIRDTGHGIPAAVLPKIFEPFYTTKPQGRGTGLGLSICYGIVEQHLGRIEVDSEPGLGSSFRVYLPVAIGAAS